MSKIIQLWNEEKLPIKDAVYFATGESIALSVQFYPKLLIEKGKKFDLNCFLKKEPDYLTNIDITKEVKINSCGKCYLGEGSYGSEGFIAYTKVNKELQWIIYFEKSNPFINAVEISNKLIEVESSANYKIIIDINNPIDIRFSL